MVLPAALLPGDGALVTPSLLPELKLLNMLSDEDVSCGEVSDKTDAIESVVNESGIVIGSDVGVSEGADDTDVILGKLGEV